MNNIPFISDIDTNLLSIVNDVGYLNKTYINYNNVPAFFQTKFFKLQSCPFRVFDSLYHVKNKNRMSFSLKKQNELHDDSLDELFIFCEKIKQFVVKNFNMDSNRVASGLTEKNNISYLKMTPFEINPNLTTRVFRSDCADNYNDCNFNELKSILRKGTKIRLVLQLSDVWKIGKDWKGFYLKIKQIERFVEECPNYGISMYNVESTNLEIKSRNFVIKQTFDTLLKNNDKKLFDYNLCIENTVNNKNNNIDIDGDINIVI